MKRIFATIGIILVLAVSARADVTFSGSGTVLPGGGAGSTGPNAVPQTVWDFTAGAGKTLTVPTGAVRLEACFASGGGGGGACTTGGAAGVSGSTGTGPVWYCVMVPQSQLSQTLTYNIGAGGNAGTCGAAPTAATNGGASQLLINAVATLHNTPVGNAGLTASTTTNGAAAAGTAQPFFNASAATAGLTMTQFIGGLQSLVGNGDAVQVNIGLGEGQGCAVTSGGACDGAIPATAGGTGYARFTWYFQ